ncbi:MAG: acetyl-CoA carboxylase carboxyltransferase subunit beta [Planctomycetota bacterium]|jgi:acetyl-CoA carboxylase carboxyl transferase subunit beta
MIVGTCKIEGKPIVLAVMNFAFMGGSMGVVVGEKVTLAVEKALELELPLVIFCCSGGARMHEGAISLMQMAKTCGALCKLEEAGGFSISVMTHPTTGGVTASFASACDVLLAEPHSLIGFAGPRVIATTIKKELPKGFQRAEFLLEKGQVDRIVPRENMRRELAKLIAYSRDEEVLVAETKESSGQGREEQAKSGKSSTQATAKKDKPKSKKKGRKDGATKAGKKGG